MNSKFNLALAVLALALVSGQTASAALGGGKDAPAPRSGGGQTATKFASTLQLKVARTPSAGEESITSLASKRGYSTEMAEGLEAAAVASQVTRAAAFNLLDIDSTLSRENKALGVQALRVLAPKLQANTPENLGPKQIKLSRAAVAMITQALPSLNAQDSGEQATTLKAVEILLKELPVSSLHVAMQTVIDSFPLNTFNLDKLIGCLDSDAGGAI